MLFNPNYHLIFICQSDNNRRLFVISFSLVFVEMTVTNAQKNNLLEIIPLWPKTWFVETYIKLLKPLEESYHNVFHFTTGNNWQEYGSRVPSFFIYQSNKGKFAIDKDGSTSIWNPEFPMTLDTGVRFHVRVEQVFDSTTSQYKIKCYLNHALFDSTINNDARDFQNMKVFACDVWHYSCTGVFDLYGFKYGAI